MSSCIPEWTVADTKRIPELFGVIGFFTVPAEGVEFGEGLTRCYLLWIRQMRSEEKLRKVSMHMAGTQNMELTVMADGTAV